MKSLLIIAICLCNMVLFGQIEINNYFLENPDMKIAYRHHTNILVVSGFPVDSTAHLFTSTDTLRNYGDNSFYYRPFTRQKWDTLSLYSNNKLIKQFIYQLENLQDVRVHLGIVRDTTVYKEYLLSNPGLVATYHPQLAICNITIRGFDISIIKSNGEQISITDEEENYDWINWSDRKIERKSKKKGVPLYGSSKFSNAQLKQLKRTKTGDIVWFKSVVMLSPDSASRVKTINLKLTIHA